MLLTQTYLSLYIWLIVLQNSIDCVVLILKLIDEIIFLCKWWAIRIAVKKNVFNYRHRWHWHLQCDHSCGLQALNVCSLLWMVHCHNKWHRPARWVHCPVQKLHFGVLNEHSHSPAVYTQRWHPSDPSHRHTLSPTVHHGRPPLCQSSGCQSWLASLVKQLTENMQHNTVNIRHKWKTLWGWWYPWKITE